MNARDLMVSPVITVPENASVQEAAKLLVRNRIGGLPVVDAKGRLVGMVSDGDLLHRAPGHGGKKRSWAAAFMASSKTPAENLVRAPSAKVADVMTDKVITAPPDMPVAEIAALLELHRVKRLPIVEGGHLLGIITRSNLVQMLASTASVAPPKPPDRSLRLDILQAIYAKDWPNPISVNVTVAEGVAHLWGYADSDADKDAIGKLVGQMKGVRAVSNHLTKWQVHWPDIAI